MPKGSDSNPAPQQPELERLRQRVAELEQSEARLRAVEEELKRCRAKSLDFINTLPQGVYEMDCEGNLLFANQQLYSLFGYAPDLAASRFNVMEFLAPAEAARARANVARLFAGDTPTDNEYLFRRPDGSAFPVSIYSLPIREKGQITGLRGIIVDISRQKRIEGELRMFKQIFESCQEAIAIGDAEGRLTYVNPAHEKLFGRPLAESRKLHYGDFLPPDSLGILDTTIKPVLTKGESWEGELDVLDATGRRFPVWLRLGTLPGPDGATHHGFALLHDISDRRRAEAALRESESRLKLALQGADLGIWDWNLETGVLVLNDSWAELLGQPTDQLNPISDIWGRLVHPDDVERVQEALKQHLKDTTPHFEVEYRLRFASGEWRWVLTRGRTMARDLRGRPLRLCGTHLDITSSRLTQQQELGHSHFMESVLNNLPVGLMVFDIPPGQVRFINDRFVEIHGWPREKLTDAKSFHECVFPDPEYRHSVRQRLQQGLIERDPSRIRWNDLWITTQAGVRKNVAVSSFLASAQDWMIFIVQDRTAQYQMEAGLQRRDAILRAVAFSAEAFLRTQVWTEVIQESLQKLGEAAQVDRVYLFRAASQPNVGSLWSQTHEWVAPGISPQINNPELQNISSENPVLRDWVKQLANGDTVCCHLPDLPAEVQPFFARQNIQSLALVPVFASTRLWGLLGMDSCAQQREWSASELDALRMAGNVLGSAILHALGNEERRKLEEQMCQVQRLESLGALAGGIAHDFNNLLTTILGNVDLTQMDLSPVSPAREPLQAISMAARRAADLCKQMLAYSGKGRLVVQNLNLTELVREMSHMLEVLISKKAILRYNFAGQLPAIHADSSQLRQCIMNLVINASEAIGDRSGIISLTTGAVACDANYLAGAFMDEKLPDGTYVFLEVSDTGCGMSSEIKGRIFDPFFTTKFTGRGLGLAAALGIVRGHHGAIKVYSEAGQGTTVKILLPAAEGPAATNGLSAPVSNLWRGSGTILLVDDEETVQAVAKRMLEKLGFQVLLAGNGREALHIFQDHTLSDPPKENITCILLDLIMPHMDGEEVYRQLRAFKKDVRVILASGYAEEEILQRFAGKGLAGIMQKPYQLETLAATLQKALSADAP